MITLGSISRDAATQWFSFLGEGVRGRRTAIRELTHGVPEFVFWTIPMERCTMPKPAIARICHRATSTS